MSAADLSHAVMTALVTDLGATPEKVEVLGAETVFVELALAMADADESMRRRIVTSLERLSRPAGSLAQAGYEAWHRMPAKPFLPARKAS